VERSTRLASAPVTWGVWERTTDGDDLIAAGPLLETVAGLGFHGIELGPPGYLTPAGLAANGLDHIEQKVAAIEQRHRKQVQQTDRYRYRRRKLQQRGKAHTRDLTGDLGDHQRATQLIRRRPAD